MRSFAPSPEARLYGGLEPNISGTADGFDVRAETTAQHNRSHPSEVDVVCAFHVVEHVADPLVLARPLERALRACADRLGLIVEATEPLPLAAHNSLICWMARLTREPAGERFYLHWSWYAALLWSRLAGCADDASRPIPADAVPLVVLLAARKP
jgi:hypothetical protein